MLDLLNWNVQIPYKEDSKNATHISRQNVIPEFAIHLCFSRNTCLPLFGTGSKLFLKGGAEKASEY